LALFASSGPATVYDGLPVAAPLTGAAFELSGLPVDSEWWGGLAVRATGSADWSPSGALLRARASTPYYVRADADPLLADGLTPATAFKEPADALLLALIFGGGNVWIAAGDYPQQALPVFPGTYVIGGFEPSFDWSTRDAELHPTRLTGAAGQAILACQDGAPGCCIDGLVLDGLDAAVACIDALDTPLVLSNTIATRSFDRGIRLRASATNDPIDVRLCGVRSELHRADGVSVQGAFELRLDACVLSNNTQEGLDCADLVAPDGRHALLALRDCVCADNLTDGVDVNLAAPPLGGAGGGTFDIEFAHSRFERNGGEGAQIDVDYDAFPAWSSAIRILGCQTRANGLNGFHLDLDLNSEALVWRSLAAANRHDGLQVSSETQSGFVMAAASAFHGNLGYGTRAAIGQRSLVVSHCALAGNQAGGLGSDALASVAVSCALWEQSNAFDDVTASGSAASQSGGLAQFERVPVTYGSLTAASGLLLSTGVASEAQLGQWGEVGDDQQPRVVSQLGSAQLALLPAPAPLDFPTAIALWSDQLGVAEDWRLAVAAPAQGVGLVMPGAPLVDAGPWGIAQAGAIGSLAPVEPSVFHAARAAPAPGTTLAPGSPQELRIGFDGGILAAFSANSSSVRVTNAKGQELAVGINVQSGELVLLPPVGGWPAGSKQVELHAGLQALDGNPLCATTVLRFL
jgi:hypothetical protein